MPWRGPAFVAVLGALAACGRVGFGSPSTAGSSDGSPATGTCGTCPRCSECSGSSCAPAQPDRVMLGHRATCYLDREGARWCAGENLEGELGMGTTSTDQPTFVRADDGAGWEALFVFYQVAYAIRGGRLFGWGLGHGPVPTELGPAPAGIRAYLGGDGPSCEWFVDGTASCDSTGAAWRAMQTNGQHVCGVKTDGTLWCWGDSYSDALGTVLADGTNIPDPFKVGTDSDWVEAGAGGTAGVGFSCARKISGDVYCWGHPRYTGLSGFDVNATPTLVVGGASWLDVHFERACASVAGEVRCWGEDTWGGQVVPGQAVASVPTVVGTFDRFVTGGHHACGQSNGRWQCFGWNTHGQLGLGHTTNVDTFVDLCP